MGNSINSFKSSVDSSNSFKASVSINQELDEQKDLELKIFIQFFLIIKYYSSKVGNVIDFKKIKNLKSIEDNIDLIPRNDDINFWISNFSKKFSQIWESGIREIEIIESKLYN